MSVPRDFRSISARQLADDLAVAICEHTKGFPGEEWYGLTQQMRRAAVSVPSNMAEGAGRDSTPEHLHFCSVAHGLLAEVRYQIHLARRLGYLSEDAHADLGNRSRRVGAALRGLTGAIRRDSQ